MFAVMGITGRVGSAVATGLLERGAKLRGIVRNQKKAGAWQEKGVEIFVADYNDSSALERAFTHAEGVFIMIPSYNFPAPGFPETRRMLEAVGQALHNAIPSKVVCLSSVGAEQPYGIGLVADSQLLEQQLGKLGIPTAFLRAGWFMENCAADLPTARERGELFSYLQPLDKAFPLVGTRDVGRAAAVIIRESWTGIRYIEVSGPRRYSPLEIAAAFSRALRRRVEAVAVPRESWISNFVAQGAPEDHTAPLVEMIDAFNSGWADFGAAGAEHFVGTTELQEVIDELASL